MNLVFELNISELAKGNPIPIFQAFTWWGLVFKNPFCFSLKTCFFSFQVLFADFFNLVYIAYFEGWWEECGWSINSIDIAWQRREWCSGSWCNEHLLYFCRKVLQWERLVPDSHKMPGLLRDSCVNQVNWCNQYSHTVAHIYGDRISSQRPKNIIFLHVTTEKIISVYRTKITVSTSAFSELFLLNSEKSWKKPFDEKNFIKMNKRKKVKPAKSFTLHTSYRKPRESHMCKMAERWDCFVCLCSEWSCSHLAEWGIAAQPNAYHTKR